MNKLYSAAKEGSHKHTQAREKSRSKREKNPQGQDF